MAVLKYIFRLERMHKLIERRATGNPEQFAEKMEMSKRNLYKYLKSLKELGADIEYDEYRQTYFYVEPYQFKIGYDKNEKNKIKGGKSTTAKIVHYGLLPLPPARETRPNKFMFCLFGW